MQQQVKIDGLLAACRKCSRQPKHWLDHRHGGTHALECSPCENKTPFFPAFQQAVEFWEKSNEQEMRV
jgi:hypothetical protein